MDKYIEVKTTKKISIQIIKDMIVTAIEGGSNYWAYFKFPENWKEKYGSYENIPFEDGNIEVIDIETDDVVGVLNIATIQIGLNLMGLYKDVKGKEVPERHFNNLTSGNFDAETADVFLQLSVMGEIVYG